MDRIALLLQLHEDDPTDTFTLFALGFEYHKQGKLHDALRWYEIILSSAPEYTGVYYHIGKVYQELGRSDNAAQAYRNGIQMCSQLKEVKDRAELQQALIELEDG